MRSTPCLGFKHEANNLSHCLYITEAQLIVPNWGVKVDSGTGYSYRPTSSRILRFLTDGPVQQPYTGINFIPSVGVYEFG